jgi:hypothetical protein
LIKHVQKVVTNLLLWTWINEAIGVLKELSMALSTFIPFWTQCASHTAVQNISRLALVYKSRTILEEKLPTVSDANSMEAVAALQVESIVDVVITNNRASLFIFLSSLVS